MTSRTLPVTREGIGERRRALPAARVPRLRPFAVFALAAVVALFAIVFARVSLDASAFELQRLDRQLATEEARQATLKVEAARLRDPVRIEEAARDLGLVFPEERVPLVVPRGSTP